jgi:Transposase DDE domain
MDRGYARVGLLLQLGLEGIPFLVRAKRNVLVYRKGKPIALGRLSVKIGQIQRYSIRYHSKKKEPLDLIIFHGKGYKEPWYLLVPANTPESAEEIVALYAKRMSIEQGFRDWKTHLGIRGMVFVNDNPAPRLTRLLLAFSLSYVLCLALGSTADSQLVRAFVEIPRRTARHGTTRTLSSLSIGILRLSLPKFTSQARIEILAIIQRLLSGKGLLPAGVPPP